MFPDKEQRIAFLDWFFIRSTRETQARMRPKFTPGELVAKIDAANLLSQSFNDTIGTALSRPTCPWIPVGLDQHFTYRLAPDTLILRAGETKWNQKIEIADYILAFDGAKRREPFVFTQLGALMCMERD